jgi:hypothetical protein
VLLIAARPGHAQTPFAEEISRIKADVSAFRDLRPKSPVREVFVTSAELRAGFEKSATDADPELRQRDNVQFWLMRLSDSPQVDILSQQTESASESVLGYYSPREKTMYIRNDVTDFSLQAKMTLAHEYAHALQDQYFDLSRVIRACNSRGVCDSDRALAGRAVVEGDATLIGFTYAQRRFSNAELESLFAGGGDGGETAGRSSFLSTLSAFPYTAGLEFVVAAARRGDSYAAVDRLFRDLPLSTEQILHPEKYLNRPRDAPKAVQVPNLLQVLGPGWRVTDNTNLGELGMRAWFAQLGAAEPERVAAGWGGDRFLFYQNGESAALVIATRWDTAQDATEFVANIEDRLAGIPREGAFWRDGARTYTLARSRDRISLIATTDPVVAQTLAQRLSTP